MVSVPPYIGLNLSLDGTGIKRPGNPVRRSEPAFHDSTNRNSGSNYHPIRKSTTAVDESRQTYGSGEKSEKSRVLAHIAREVPRVGLYTGTKGSNHGGPSGGGATHSSSTAAAGGGGGNNAHSSSSNTSNDSQSGGGSSGGNKDSQAHKAVSPSSSSHSSSSAPRVAGGTTTSQPSSSSSRKTHHHQHANPTRSLSMPKTTSGPVPVAAAATPLTFSLNNMTSVLQASLQKLESDSLPVMNSALRRPSEPRKLLGAHLLNNSVSEYDKDKLLASDRIHLTATGHKSMQSDPAQEAPTPAEALARGNLGLQAYKWDTDPVCGKVKADSLLPLRKRMPARRARRRKPPPGFHANRVMHQDPAQSLGIKFPEHNALMHMPKVPYVNVNVSYKAHYNSNPKMKYMQLNTTLDRVQQINADLEKIHRITEIK